MSLTDLIKSSVELAFEMVKDLVPLGIFYVRSEGVYDSATDRNTLSDTQIVNVRMLVVQDKQRDVTASSASVLDQKTLIPASDLGVIPTTKDYLFLQGVWYNISEVASVPTDSLHILMCRKR